MNGDDDERTPDDPVREQLDAMIELAEDRRMLLAREIAIIDADVTRWRSARAVLDGQPPPGRVRSKSTRPALLAALASFQAPVTTQTLLDHPDLVHYSRSALRSTLGELRKGGLIRVVERTPHGFIWSPEVRS